MCAASVHESVHDAFTGKAISGVYAAVTGAVPLDTLLEGGWVGTAPRVGPPYGPSVKWGFRISVVVMFSSHLERVFKNYFLEKAFRELSPLSPRDCPEQRRGATRFFNQVIFYYSPHFCILSCTLR